MAYTNYSTAIMLFDDKVRLVRTAYEDTYGAPAVLFKTLDASIEVGDIVVVPSNTRHLFTTVKVRAVDIPLDPESTDDIKWVACRADTEQYESIVSKEDKMIQTLKASQTRAKREALKKNLTELANDEELTSLALLSSK